MGPSAAKLAVRVAGVAAILGGILGTGVWIHDLEDRADGDSLRYGVWHNPYLQFPIFSYPFVEPSCWILLGCCLVAVAGGILLLIPKPLGRALVVWQARVAFVINAVTVMGILWMMIFMMPRLAYRFQGTPTALCLRLGVLIVDFGLLAILTSRRSDGAFTDARADHAFPVLPAAEVGNASSQ